MSEVNEFKASYGVNAEVPEPVAKGPVKPRNQEDSDNPDQGSSGPLKAGRTKADASPTKSSSASSGMPGSGPNRDTAPHPQGSSKIAREDIDVSDDVDAIFEGVELSEDAKNRAAVILETAVVTHVNAIAEQIQEDMQTQLEQHQEEMTTELTEKLDEYLDYVIENWMEENALSVETGLRAEMTESFIQGLKGLFEDHYVDIPEEETDVVEELASRIEALESALSEEMERNIDYSSKVKSFEREVAFVEVAEGLTETQAAKLESLSESVNFTNAEEFKTHLETLRESYFPSSSDSKREINEGLDEDPIELDEEVRGKPISDPSIARYADYISKSVGSK